MRAVLFLLLLVTASPALGQTTVLPGSPYPGSPGAADVTAQPSRGSGLQYDLDRIRRELARPDSLRSYFGDDGRIVFRVEVEGQLPRFSDFIGGNQALVGPSPWGSMTHSDFLDLVTPKQAQPFGAFTGGDLLQVLATSLATAFALNGGGKALGAVKDAIHERRVRSAEQEVQRVLTENERQRQAELEKKLAEEEAAKKQAQETQAPEKSPAPEDPKKATTKPPQ